MHHFADPVPLKGGHNSISRSIRIKVKDIEK